MMIGLLAVLIFAGVPFSTPAATYSGPAPADEYFGPHKQSILEIRNRLDRMDTKSDRELIDDNAIVELDDIAASVSDWRSQYPNDPWLPRFYARLLHDYHRAGASSSDRAVAMLDEMKTAYPDAPETSEIVAMTYAGGTLVPVPVPVPVAAAPVYMAPAPAYAVPVTPVAFAAVTPATPQLRPGAWQRFDSMRAGGPTTPATSTTVTTTVTTTTGSGGP
ncbi:MAG TPA: hypothetical protein VMG98_12675 [Verrucomicrobiae bacterium]|nr:hypothetical protein [Verrucomicrobiae bacterium]